MTIAASLGLLFVAGCGSSNGDGVPDDPRVSRVGLEVYHPNPGPTLDLDDFEYEWSDVSRDDKGRRDALEVARWVTERYDAALLCLNQEPPSRKQAHELLEEVLRRVPDTTRARYLQARLRFADAAYWFKATDVFAYEIFRLRLEKTAPKSEGGSKLSDEEVEKRAKSFEPGLKKANEQLKKTATMALRDFALYRKIRPDDKEPLDYIWKLHLYLQNYSRALEWLEYVLIEFENNDVPRQDPLRRDYEEIHGKIKDYLAFLRVEGIEVSERSSPAMPFREGGVWSGRANDRLGEDRR